MKTYRIISVTNGYQAQRSTLHAGKCEIVLIDGLTLKEAQSKLLSMYNDDFADERPAVSNWGLAVIQSAGKFDGARATEPGGLRSYEFDGFRVSIEEEDEERI